MKNECLSIQIQFFKKKKKNRKKNYISYSIYFCFMELFNRSAFDQYLNLIFLKNEAGWDIISRILYL